MDGSNQIKVVSVILLICRINFSGKTLINCFTLFEQNSVHFQLLPETIVLKLMKPGM